MCSGSEAGSYLRLKDLLYHSTLGLRVIKKKKEPIVENVGKHTVKMAPECPEREVFNESLKGTPAFDTLPISAGYISPELGSVGRGPRESD